jgi:hypothetical protein
VGQEKGGLRKQDLASQGRLVLCNHRSRILDDDVKNSTESGQERFDLATQFVCTI